MPTVKKSEWTKNKTAEWENLFVLAENSDGAIEI